MWMLIVSREKLGVATASIGGGFYTLMALSAWLIYGETLSALQWAGIVIVTLGVVCISLGGVRPRWVSALRAIGAIAELVECRKRRGDRPWP
jgi:drug/metabolite transporter (DMT)-like permease